VARQGLVGRGGRPDFAKDFPIFSGSGLRAMMPVAMASLSRTYRPSTFADITDQGPIKETLRREVATGKLGHAYLFGGPRGVGKTTTARIFAKALVCLAPKDGEPCNACAACVEASEGRALDIIEMDAASNTGVDHVREAIVEHVRFAPVARARKVYILDEAHMLSTSAWNALLKTLEEPPAYAVFILITTELHKVPATILSRCQRFDFGRIPDGPMGERIRWIAGQEGVEVADDVVKLIVAKSEGCLRDAESLLGQLFALEEKKIDLAAAALVLPVSRLPLAAETLYMWSKRSLPDAFAQIAGLEDAGVAILPLVDDLILAIRRLLRAAETPAEAKKLAEGDEGEKKLSQVVGLFAPAELTEMALTLMERRRDAKQGVDPRFCLELAASTVVLGMLPHGPNAAPPTPAAPAPVPSALVRPSASPTPPPAVKPISSSPPAVAPKPAAAVPPAVAASAPSSPLPVATFTLDDVLIAWPKFMRWIEEKSPSLSFVLRVVKPARVEGGLVWLRFQYPFHREKVVGDLKTKRLVEDGLGEAMKVKVQVDGVVEAEPESGQSHGMVDAVLKAFGGEVVEDLPAPTAAP
jgi:DNA polymerase-3 subunit gamma/tau